MSHNLPKVMQRIEDLAIRIMEQETSSAKVLNDCINQYALPLINFKRTGRPPNIGSLEELAGKLVAIVAASYDMQDMRTGKLP